jgi:hypothetical protein
VETTLHELLRSAKTLWSGTPPPAAGPSRRKSIFGRRGNDRENKEPPQRRASTDAMWVMCEGTCKAHFGWTVASQAHYRQQNKPKPRMCPACAHQHNHRIRAHVNNTR